MAEQRQTVITRRGKFTVAGKDINDYGDLIVRDTNGLEHKIGKKRARLFDIFQEGAEVQVGYAEYMQKEYIATAEQTGQHNMAQEVAKLPPQKPQSPPPQQGEPSHQPAPQELGMWWKELGEMLRAKDIDTTKPAGKLMRTVYYAQMMSVLDIKITNKEP